MQPGIIFDFNGTLFWDTDYHDEAWMKYSEMKGWKITRRFLRESLHGKVNREIFRTILGSELTSNEASVLSEEKESIYREIVNDLDGGAQLAKGVLEVLDTLKSRKKPMAIATSSSKENVDFYINKFDLHKWFKEEHIIYDDGSFQGKPAPDIFLIAANRLGINPADCTVVEDSVTGIKAAQAAGIGEIFLITSGNHLAWDYSDDNIQVIKDFTDFSNSYL